MKYQLKYIKNPPTTADLFKLYESDVYNQIIKRMSNHLNEKFDDTDDRQMIRQHIKRLFLILNIPIDEINTSLQANKNALFHYVIERHKYYENYTDEQPDGEFGEGDESEEIEEGSISKSFLLSTFCEFYLLLQNDKERLLHYLKTTGMPYAKKHMAEIATIYKSASKK